jgi:hypothetical protein
LTNTNESATVAKAKNFRELNAPSRRTNKFTVIRAVHSATLAQGKGKNDANVTALRTVESNNIWGFSFIMTAASAL